MPSLENQTVIPSDLSEARRVQEEIEAALSTTSFSEHDRFAVKMAFEEAIVNAIKHGNQMDPEKSVVVEYQILPDLFLAKITDQGEGFDPDDVPDPTAPENLERPCGRGLLLIRYYMTEVSFTDGGRTIVLKKSPSTEE
jgi:serine/threonine-protein kinase RsbW